MALVFRKVSTVIGQTVRSWRPGFTYLAGDLVIPLTDNGRAYNCVIGGAAAATEPTWPTTQGGTVVDGAVTWQEATLVDVNLLGASPASSSGLGLVDDPDFGAVDTQVTYDQQPPVPGAVEVMAYHPPATMSLKVRPKGVNWDGTLAQYELLSENVATPGTWLLKADGASESRFVDTHSGKIAGPWRGQDHAYLKTVGQGFDVEGVPVVMDREPYIRGALLEAAGNSVSNATLLEDSNNDGRPERWIFDATTGVSAESISWALRGHAFTLATGNTRKLQQGSFGVTPAKDAFTIAAAVGDIWSFSFYCSGSGGTATATIEFLTAAGAVVGGGTFSSAGTALSGGPVQLLDSSGSLSTSATRVSVTTTAAPATTALVRFTMQYANTSGSNKSIVWGFAQGEKTPAVTAFRCGPETVRNDVGAEQPSPFAFVATVGAAGNVNAGLHRYRVTMVTPDGETPTGTMVTANPGVASQVSLTAIPLGSARVTARKIYRTKAGAADSNANYFLLTTLADDTTTTFNDNVADAALPGTIPPTAALATPPFQGRVWGYNPSNVTSPMRVRTTPEAGGQVVGMLLGVRSTRDGDNLAEFVNASRFGFNAYGATLYTDTGASSNSSLQDFSGGEYALTTFATVTALVRRFRKNISPTDPSALLGTFQVWANLWLGLSGAQLRVGARYGFGSSTEDPLPFALDTVPLDTTNLGSSILTLCPIYLGMIQVPLGAAGLFMELWAGQDAGGAMSIAFDTVRFLPADEGMTLLVVPGFQSDGAGPEVWLGARLDATISDFVNPTRPGGTTVSTSYKNNQLILSANNKAAGTPPTGGVVLQPGRHVFTAFGDMYQADQSGTKLGELRIYNVTDNVLAASVDLKPKSGKTWTKFGGPGSTRVARVVVDVPAGNVKAYQAEVIFTAATTVGWKMYLSKIKHEVVPYVGDGTTVMALDGDIDRATTLTAPSGSPLDPLVAPTGFLDAPPGLFVTSADLWDVPPVGFDLIDARMELANHKMARDALMAQDIAPQYLPM